MAVRGNTFENIYKRAERQGHAGSRSKESLDWFRNSIRKTTRTVSPERLMREAGDGSTLVNSWTNTAIGKMYLVTYDPKHKKTLPYYDVYPLMIPFEKRKDSMLALNLHYLPPILRAKLLDSLYEKTLSDKNLGPKARFNITYGILKGLSSTPYYKPCVKMYLPNHFRSRFLRIEPQNWTPAVFLPIESFVKQSKQTIWGDSRRML